MKRTLSAITAALLMLSMTACGAQTAPTESETQNEQTEQDLYDKLDIIPFDKLEEFFSANLKRGTRHE